MNAYLVITAAIIFIYFYFLLSQYLAYKKVSDNEYAVLLSAGDINSYRYRDDRRALPLPFHQPIQFKCAKRRHHEVNNLLGAASADNV